MFHQTRNIRGWEVPTVAFGSPARDPLALLVLGEVLNEFASNAARKRDWKIHVAASVKEARGPGPWDPGDDYVISLAFRFHPGLFCDDDTQPTAIERWDYDDSNFSTLFVHRLPNTPDSWEEGVAFFVSSR